MAEFDEEDLRPFSSTSRPRTSAPAAQRMAVAGEGEAGVAGPRPATGLRPKTGYRQQQQQQSSRMGTAAGPRVDNAVWSVELDWRECCLLEVPFKPAASHPKSRIFGWIDLQAEMILL